MADVNKVIASSGGDYTSISSMLSDAASNKSTGDRWLVSYERSDEVTEQVLLTGNYNTTSDANGIIISVASAHRHDGKWNTGKARIAHTSSYDKAIIHTDTAAIAPFLTFKGFQFDQKANNGDNAQHIVACRSPGTFAAGSITLVNCIARWSGGNAGYLMFYGPGTAGAFVFKCINCIVYDGTYAIRFVTYSSAHAVKAYFFNCTFYNMNPTANSLFNLFDIDNTSAILQVKNTYVHTSGGQAVASSYTATETFSNNKKSDSVNTVSGWTNGVTPTFVDSANRDFHLQSSDTALKDAGVDLSSEGYTDDIDYVTRTGTWDIGADEYTSAPASDEYCYITSALG